MNEVSVIIVSWNAKAFLRQCLLSIYETGGTAIREVIVVDNASTDGSPEMVVEAFPQVSLIRSRENLGFARANNLGMQRATAPCLALVNSDVIVHPGCLQKLTDYLQRHPRVGLLGPLVCGGDQRPQRTCRRLPTIWNTLCGVGGLDSLFPQWPLFSGREMRHWNQDTCAEVEVLSGCFWMVRRAAVAQVGGLDERFFFYGEDVDWCKRFWDAGWKVVFLPEATATHFGGASSDNAPLRYSIQLLRASLFYWRKHKGRFGQVAFYMLAASHHVLRLVLRGCKLMVRPRSAEQTAYKFKRSWVCLRWLLTGKEAG